MPSHDSMLAIWLITVVASANCIDCYGWLQVHNCLMITAVASASGSASASSSTSVARSTAVSTKETTTTESKVVQMMTLVASILFMAFKMSLMTLLTMMTMMALKILFNVADLPRAGFEGTVRVDRIREEIGQYSWPFMLAKSSLHSQKWEISNCKSLWEWRKYLLAEIPSPPSCGDACCQQWKGPKAHSSAKVNKMFVLVLVLVLARWGECFVLVSVSVLVLVSVLPRNGKVLVIVCRRVFLEVNNNQTWCFGLKVDISIK